MHLMVARNVLDVEEEKFFVSNAGAETAVSKLLLGGFSRWQVERCSEDQKSEIGLDQSSAKLLKRTVEKIDRTQRRNASARKSHTKATRMKLRALGIKLTEIRRCVWGKTWRCSTRQADH